MRRIWTMHRGAVWLLAGILPPVCAAQQPCGAGTADVRGTVADTSGARIAGAALRAGAATATSGPDGNFVLSCVANGGVIRVEAASFAPAEVKADAAARVMLEPMGAHEEVSVTAYRTPRS